MSFRSKSVGWLGGLTRGLLLLLVRPVVLRMYLGTTVVLVADLGVTSCASGLRAMDSCCLSFSFRFVLLPGLLLVLVVLLGSILFLSLVPTEGGSILVFWIDVSAWSVWAPLGGSFQWNKYLGVLWCDN